MKDPNAVALGRKGGLAGTGKAKSRPNMKEIGRLGGLARQAKRREAKQKS